jgi:hypothetical protein
MSLHDERICRFLDQCSAVGIRNPVEFLLSKVPIVYSWLKGAFPRGILPTDIDGEVELNHRFLRFEFKHERCLREGAIPKGQHILFERLVRTGFFSVLLIGQDDAGRVTCYQAYTLSPAGTLKVHGLVDANEAAVADLCKRWVAKVEALPVPNKPAA